MESRDVSKNSPKVRSGKLKKKNEKKSLQCKDAGFLSHKVAPDNYRPNSLNRVLAVLYHDLTFTKQKMKFAEKMFTNKTRRPKMNIFEFILKQSNNVTLTTRLHVTCTATGVPIRVRKEASVTLNGNERVPKEAQDVPLEGDGQLAQLIQHDQLFPEDIFVDSRWRLRVQMVGTKVGRTFESSRFSPQQACDRAYQLVTQWMSPQQGSSKRPVLPPSTHFRKRLDYRIAIFHPQDETPVHYTKMTIGITAKEDWLTIKWAEHSADPSGKNPGYLPSDPSIVKLPSAALLKLKLLSIDLFPQDVAESLQHQWIVRVMKRVARGRHTKMVDIHSRTPLTPKEACEEAIKEIVNHTHRVKSRIDERVDYIPLLDLSITK